MKDTAGVEGTTGAVGTTGVEATKDGIREERAIPRAAGQPGESGGKIFKQIERVKRQRMTGVLSQKDGVWYLTTSDGPYKVLEASIKHFDAREESKNLTSRRQRNV